MQSLENLAPAPTISHRVFAVAMSLAVFWAVHQLAVLLGQSPVWKWHMIPFWQFFFFAMLYGSLVPQPGIKPIPTVVAVQSLNHWTAREVSLPSIPAINIDSGVVTQSSYVKRASPDGSQPCWDLESLTSSSHWGRVCGLRGQERWRISRSFNGNWRIVFVSPVHGMKEMAIRYVGKELWASQLTGPMLVSVSLCLWSILYFYK